MVGVIDRNSQVFRFLDRGSRLLGRAFFGDGRRLSTHLGNALIAQNASWYHLIVAGVVDLITFEHGHCFKNAGKE